MKYMILHYFFMVHFCNIKLSAISTRHKSKGIGRHYDIDGFISQLLASRKFDDLAEKLAEKAANKIMLKDAAPAHIQRATNDNDKNITESTQEINQKQSNREYINKIETNQMTIEKLRKEFSGKINPQAVINATISLSENLQLKYKYLKKNALEKRVKGNENPLPKNDTKEDSSKINKTIEPAVSISNQNAIEKNQNDTTKESIIENKRSRDDMKDDDGKEDPNRNSELDESFHSGTDGETNDSSKNQTDNSLEELSPENELTIFHEAQNSGPERKGIVEQEASQVNGTRELKPSSLDEENQKNLTRSEENSIEAVEKTEGEPKKSGTEEMNEGENVIAQFRASEDSIEDNKVTSDYNRYVGVYRTKASDDSGDDRSNKQSPEDQRSTVQSSEDKGSKEQSGEDPNSSKLKPEIRREGDQLYTYVRAPEYEDYHENLAKWRKQHPENPVDFLK